MTKAETTEHPLSVGELLAQAERARAEAEAAMAAAQEAQAQAEAERRAAMAAWARGVIAAWPAQQEELRWLVEERRRAWAALVLAGEPDVAAWLAWVEARAEEYAAGADHSHAHTLLGNDGVSAGNEVLLDYTRDVQAVLHEAGDAAIGAAADAAHRRRGRRRPQRPRAGRRRAVDRVSGPPPLAFEIDPGP